MTNNVEPEEARAILDMMDVGARSKAPPIVEPRDFVRPRRLGRAQLERVTRSLGNAFKEVERALLRRLRGKGSLELVEVSEVGSDVALGELDAPFCVLRFLVGAEPGWAIWQGAGAVAAIEVALGAAAPAEPVARPLTSIEKTVLDDLLRPIVAAAAGSLELSVGEFAVVDTVADLGSWRDGGPTADPQRLDVHFGCDGPGGESSLRLLLPGVAPEHNESGSPFGLDLPSHLEEVVLQLSARLGDAQIPLAELLAIEVGDVIPLDVEATAGVRIWVEDCEIAGARLGSKHGSLAVAIEQPLSLTSPTDV